MRPSINDSTGLKEFDTATTATCAPELSGEIGSDQQQIVRITYVNPCMT